ncbi:MAG: hypothetical protein ABJQ29_11605 [Luteolibacter sp.]
MNETRHFQLIDGTFTPQEAGQVLGSMVKSKIDYHTRENHSDMERSGGKKAHSETRLRDLRELNASLREFFESTNAGNHNLKFSGQITIEVLD